MPTKTRTQATGAVAGGPKDVAERYGVSETVVRRAIRAKKLKASPLGRRIIVRFSDAEDWIFSK